MATKKKSSRKLSATQRLYNNVKRAVSRREKKGQYIPSEVKETIRQAKESNNVDFLKNLASGKGKSKYSALESAIKEALKPKPQQPFDEQNFPFTDEELEAGRIEPGSESDLLKEALEEIESGKWRDEEYDIGEIILDRLNRMIDTYPTNGSKYLANLLNSEIKRYSQDKVIRAISHASPQMISAVEQEIYYEDDADSNHSTLREFAEMIQGYIADDEQQIELAEYED